MTPERWGEVQRLFDAAVECAPGERAALLAEACGADATLRREVEVLLAADAEAGSFINTPAAARLQGLAAERPRTGEGARVGAYQLLAEIGRGGMGAVYLAGRADGEFTQRVAVKLIKRGMDSDEILRRFYAERQILAALDHPHIARLLDGGTTEDGLPYFVMEHVAGEPMDAYCRRRRLGVTARLRLFLDVCAAVEYAHQRLVIHRDLKPSNILVTEAGDVKLLDFGIAKLLTPEPAGAAASTATAERLMTPEYASPEQARGERVTTASDVYSLGVVLYELLTGRRPYRVTSRLPRDILRAVCESEPERPSVAASRALAPEEEGRNGDPGAPRLARALRGDLDNIVLMALRKEPHRRYASVNQLAEDIRRHLSGLPVAAHADSLLYRSRKFVDRHRLGAAASAFILLTLLSAVAVTARQARVAREAQAQAEQERAQAVRQRALAESQRERAEEALAAVERERERAERERERAAEQEALAEMKRIEAETQRALAERRFADVRGLAHALVFNFYEAIRSLPGSTAVQHELVTRAVEYLDRLARDAGDNPELQREVAAAYEKLGDVQGLSETNVGARTSALGSYRKALALRQSVAAARPGDEQAVIGLMRLYSKQGTLLQGLAQLSEAEQAYREGLTLADFLAAKGAEGAEARRTRGYLLLKLGALQERRNEPTRALESYRQGLALRRTTPGGATQAVALGEAWEELKFVARAELQSGNLGDSLKTHRAMVELAQRALTQAPRDVNARMYLAVSHRLLAESLMEVDQNEDALAEFRRSLAAFNELCAQDGANAEAQRRQGRVQRDLAALLRRLGRREEALHYYRLSLANAEARVRRDPQNRDALQDVHIAHYRLGELLALAGEHRQALEHYQATLALRERLAAQEPEEATLQIDLAFACGNLGDLHEAMAAAAAATARQAELWRAARAWHERSYEIMRRLHERGKLRPQRVVKIEEERRAIARCEAALAKLN